MASLFSRDGSKTTPKTLNDCLKPDSAANDLWYWSEKICRWGQVLLAILIIAGLILSISAGTANMRGEDKDTKFFTAAFTSFLPWLMYAFVEYVVYHVLSLMIGAAAAITQNTAVAANVALYTAANCPCEESGKAPENKNA